MPDSTADPKRGAARFLPVVFVVSNIVGLYLIYTFFHIVPLLHDPETHDLANLEALIFNIVTLLLVICYIQCILVHPGTIPDRNEDPSWEYVPQEKAPKSSGLGQLQELKKTGERRHCKWCAKYKPDRCHHCRICRMCILKMDHHCPWIYNCVGFRNHKYFILLLMYSAITTIFIAWTMLGTVLNCLDGDTPFFTKFFLLFGETLAVFIGLLFTPFFGFHIWLMFKAMTTIEFCEKYGYNQSAYDRGVYGNITAVLGDNPLFWLLPCCSPSGRGVHFQAEDMRLARDVETGRGIRKRQSYSQGYGMHGAGTYLDYASASLKPHRKHRDGKSRKIPIPPPAEAASGELPPSN